MTILANELPALDIKQSMHTNATYKLTRGRLYVTNPVTLSSIYVCADDGVWRVVPKTLFREFTIELPEGV
jgi:hypothetical protein